MDEREKKILAFLAGYLYKLSNGMELDFNDDMQLQNILSELGYQDLEPDEFRY